MMECWVYQPNLHATILNSKGRDIMQNHSIHSMMIILISSLLSACSMSDWWNGHYATRAAIIADQQEAEAYYAAESPATKALREKNHLICWSEAVNEKDRSLFTPVYDRCMRRRGTPMWHDGLDK